MVETAIKKLIDQDGITLVLHGGLFSDNLFTERLKERLKESNGELKIIQPEIPAVIGAYLISFKRKRNYNHRGSKKKCPNFLGKYEPRQRKKRYLRRILK